MIRPKIGIDPEEVHELRFGVTISSETRVRSIPSQTQQANLLQFAQTDEAAKYYSGRAYP